MTVKIRWQGRRCSGGQQTMSYHKRGRVCLIYRTRFHTLKVFLSSNLAQKYNLEPRCRRKISEFLNNILGLEKIAWPFKTEPQVFVQISYNLSRRSAFQKMKENTIKYVEVVETNEEYHFSSTEKFLSGYMSCLPHLWIPALVTRDGKMIA